MRILAILSVTICLCIAQLTAQLPGHQTARVLTSDFLSLVGSWEGKLTYIDYTSHKSVTMPARLEMRQLGTNLAFRCFHSYPTEPNANSTDTLTIGNDGTTIDGSTVTSRSILADGSIELVTIQQATDGNDNRQAQIRHTYTISATSYRIRKEVHFNGSHEWLQRHEIVYSSRK